MANSVAPIILFVYNRPWHTQQTIEALQKNELASKSVLFIYSDAPKNGTAAASVAEVRAYVSHVTGFKKITVVKRDKNWGLADSIIDGVTSVVNQFGKVIVLEDDHVTSPLFLTFMNDALTRYEDQPQVWHISGWNYPVDLGGLDDIYFWRVMNCWGWATWSDRWQNFDKNPKKMINSWSRQKIAHFDLDASGVFWPQVISNVEGKIATWAIFWYATIYEHGGLCLNPTISYVENIGLDGSGVHCGLSESHACGVENLCQKKIIRWPSVLHESVEATEANRLFYIKQKKFRFFYVLRLFLKKAVSSLCKFLP